MAKCWIGYFAKTELTKGQMKNLGLGVFEQKDGNDSSESDNENDEDENDIIIPASSSKPSIENPTIEELPSHSTEEDKAISDKEEKSSSSSSSSEEEV